MRDDDATATRNACVTKRERTVRASTLMQVSYLSPHTATPLVCTRSGFDYARCAPPPRSSRCKWQQAKVPTPRLIAPARQRTSSQWVRLPVRTQLVARALTRAWSEFSGRQGAEYTRRQGPPVPVASSSMPCS